MPISDAAVKAAGAADVRFHCWAPPGWFTRHPGFLRRRSVGPWIEKGRSLGLDGAWRRRCTRYERLATSLDP
jgi:hypothetical protein